MKVVIDTNIFVSGLFFGGIPRAILDLIDENIIQPCFLIQTFKELERVLNDKKFARERKFLLFPTKYFLDVLQEHSLFYKMRGRVPAIISGDRADDYILACAFLARASFIITGDNDLLALKKFKNTIIAAPKVFLKKYYASGKRY